MPCMCWIRSELFSSYIPLTDKHTTIFLLYKSQNDTIKLTIMYVANLPNALALVTWRWKFLRKNIKSTVNPAVKTDVTSINSKCIYSPNYWGNFLAQRWNTFWDWYKLGPFRPMRRLHPPYGACALILNTISARWQSQNATPTSGDKQKQINQLIFIASQNGFLSFSSPKHQTITLVKGKAFCQLGV